jgi:hypothetical protein
MQAEILQQLASPTASPWLDPRFLIVAIPLSVGLIAWFLRGEFKSNANSTRQKEFEESITAYVDEIKAEHRELKKAFYAHQGDTRVHHNAEMFREFREGLERRFTTLDTTLREISGKLDARPGTHRTQG